MTTNASRDPEKDPEKDLLTIEQVATMLHVSVATLRWWKHIGKGPKWIKVGRRIRYWRHDVLDWLDPEIAGGSNAA